jgi:alpha-L-rhamnosidase
LWRAARWSYLSNLHSIPTDCPTREKNGWTGDAQLAAETGIYNFEPASVYTKWMNDFDDAQGAAGDLPGIIPSGGWGYGKAIGPAWDTAYFHIPWYLYRYYGDTRILAAHYDRMVRYVDYVTKNRDADGTVSFGLGDWAPYEAQTPPPLTSTAYYYRDLLILSEAAKVLGRPGDTAKYADMAAATKDAFNKRFFNAKAETYANGTQTALSCALYQGLVPADHEAAVFENLVKAIHARNDHLDCGILGTKYVPNVLLDHGRADLAYKIASQTDLPSWGYWMKAKGATTLYESWKDVDSRNHIMFGDISAWLFRALAGIRPDEAGPGFRTVTIRPQVVGDLTQASATYHSIRGPISSAWTRSGDTLELTVTIPANVTATVYVPTTDPGRVTESGGPAGKAAGVRQARAEDGVAVYTVGSGTYRFSAPQRVAQ